MAIQFVGGQLPLRVIYRVFYPVAGQGIAEIRSGYLLDQVRFVEYHGVVLRDDLSERIMTSVQVGEKKVVIYHHDIGHGRVGPHFAHET